MRQKKTIGEYPATFRYFLETLGTQEEELSVSGCIDLQNWSSIGDFFENHACGDLVSCSWVIHEEFLLNGWLVIFPAASLGFVPCLHQDSGRMYAKRCRRVFLAATMFIFNAKEVQ